MDGEKPTEHGFVSPWSCIEPESANDEDYFPPYYPVDDNLVIPASQSRDE